MTDWEKDLPPIARERLARIGGLARQEKEDVMNSERVNSLLSEFYQGKIGPEGLWKSLRAESKPSLLREAQMKLVNSLSFASPPADVQRKRDGMIAIETLKEEQNTPAVETSLDLIEDLQRRYRAEVEQVYNGLKGEVERNPQLRIRQVRQKQGTVMVHLTIDEAIQQLPQWTDFLSKHEERYTQEFGAALERLRSELS